MVINGYCRRKLAPIESAAVSGFAQLVRKGCVPMGALVLTQSGDTLVIAYTENEENKLKITSTSMVAGAGTDGAKAVAAAKIAEDFRKKEGIDLTANAQAMERLENAVEEALATLANSYTAEIFLPFIADVSHLEAHLTRMDADALLADSMASVKNKITEMCPDLAETAFIISAPQADQTRLARALKELSPDAADRTVSDDGSGQSLEDEWIVKVLDQGESADYPAFADQVLPSAEALILGRFAPVCRELKSSAAIAGSGSSEADAFAHGVMMAADRLETALNAYHAMTACDGSKEETIDVTAIALGDMKSLMKDVLAVMDDLERGLAGATEEKRSKDAALNDITETCTATHTHILAQLATLGITPIDAEGRTFDPHFHDAAMHIDDEKLEENVVAQELRKGYMYGNSVLRYSVVKVAN